MRRKLSVAIRKYNSKLQNLSPSEKAKLNHVNELAKELMLTYHLNNYKFMFGYGWRYYGKCSAHTITLSLNFALAGSIEQIKNTLLHEIAHAVVGINCGHRFEWQQKANEFGVTWYKNYHK